MVAQIFNPILTSPNENVLKNTGFNEDFDYWEFYEWEQRKGIIDSETKHNNVISIKNENGKIFLLQDVPYLSLSDEMNLSFYIKSQSYTNCKLYFLGETREEAMEFVDLKYFEIAKPTITDEFVRVSLSVKVSDLGILTFWHWFFGLKVENDVDTWVSNIKLEYGSVATDYRPAIADNIKWELSNEFQDAKIGDIATIISYNCQKSLTTVGSFSMSIPKNTLFVNEIKADCFILYDGDWLIVNNVKLENDIYTIEGTDAKGLLSKRVTYKKHLFLADTLDFDGTYGTTEECLKFFISRHLVSPADSERKISLLSIAKDKGRGLANDSYMSMLEPLDEVATKLCQHANIGYDITVDLLNNKMIFDVIDVIDKTVNQRERNQIIFDVERGNITSLSRELGNSNYKNVFYAHKGEDSNGDLQFSKVIRQGAEPAGVERNEMQLNVSCNSFEEIANMAKQEMTNYKETDSFDVEINNPTEYGVLYSIGDKVTLKDTFTNTTSDKVIRGFDKLIANGQKTITLNFGEGKPKPLNKLNQKIKQKGVL